MAFNTNGQPQQVKTSQIKKRNAPLTDGDTGGEGTGGLNIEEAQ